MADTFTSIGTIAAKLRKDAIDKRVENLTDYQIIAKRFPSVHDTGLRDLEREEIDPEKFSRIRDELPASITVEAVIERMLVRLGPFCNAYDDSDKQADTANYVRRQKAKEAAKRKASRL